MTPFLQFVLIDALLLTLLVTALIWIFRTSAGSIWLKVGLAVAFAILTCWSPLATRAILGYPQPRPLAELPDKFQLLAQHSNDDKAFDLWIVNLSEHTPLAVTVTPDANMRKLLRDAQQRLGQGEPVIISRKAHGGRRGQAGGGEDGEAQGSGHGHATDNGSTRTHFDDDQTKFELVVPDIMWRKDGP